MANVSSQEDAVLVSTVDLPKSKQKALVIEINRPNKQNCFNTQVVYTLANIFYEIASNSSPKYAAIVFTGKGSSFCAGADLSDPPNPLQQSSDLPSDLRLNPVYQMSQIAIPIIGAAHGYCITGGMELILACDIIVADTTTIFRDTHVKFGLAPCWGLSQKLRQRVGPGRAKLISYSARPVDASLAYSWGLIDELVPKDTSSLQRALEIADNIGKQDLQMVQRYKNALEGGSLMDLSRGLERERSLALAHYLQAIHDGTTFEGAKEYITSDSRRGNNIPKNRSKL